MGPHPSLIAEASLSPGSHGYLEFAGASLPGVWLPGFESALHL